MRIAWIDVESTGLKPPVHNLLQVACLITDMELNILEDEGYYAEIKYSADEVKELKAKSDPYVFNMHTNTNLWDKLEYGKPLDTVDQELHKYISSFIGKDEGVVGGNSITLDRNFMDEYLPLTFDHLNYQSIDVSSVALLAKAWYNGMYFEKEYAHDAMSDIRESIAQLKWLRANAWK